MHSPGSCCPDRSGQQLPGEALVLSFYCTDTFRGGHSSILVVGDHRGLIG
jgi:hypothetical protein